MPAFVLFVIHANTPDPFALSQPAAPYAFEVVCPFAYFFHHFRPSAARFQQPAAIAQL